MLNGVFIPARYSMFKFDSKLCTLSFNSHTIRPIQFSLTVNYSVGLAIFLTSCFLAYICTPHKLNYLAYTSHTLLFSVYMYSSQTYLAYTSHSLLFSAVYSSHKLLFSARFYCSYGIYHTLSMVYYTYYS